MKDFLGMPHFGGKIGYIYTQSRDRRLPFHVILQAKNDFFIGGNG